MTADAHPDRAASRRLDPAATIFVTRPEPDATSLVLHLQSRGRAAVAFPALTIGPADDPAPLVRAMADLDRYRLVVFVSPNAIRQAVAARLAPWPRATTIGVMGPGSVAALDAAGVDATIVSPSAGDASRGERFDSEALLERLRGVLSSFDADDRVLIVRGNGGRGWLANQLRRTGVAVDEVEAYRRSRGEPVAAAIDAVRTARATRAATIFFVTSSEAIEHLVTLVEDALAGIASQPNARAWLFDTTVVAPHARIVEKATRAGFRHVIAVDPGDDGLFAAIE